MGHWVGCDVRESVGGKIVDTVTPPARNTMERDPLFAGWLLMRSISCLTRSMKACRSAVTPLLLASTVRAL